MKTTIDVHDDLLERAKRHAKSTGRPLRSIVEEGLRRVLSASDEGKPYRMPDHRVGDPDAEDPLDGFSWPELRETIYGDSGAR